MSGGMGMKQRKAYPAYKDSGVEWLGQVPEEWRIGRVAYGYEIVLGKMLQPNPKDEQDQMTPYYRAINIQWEAIVGEPHEMWASPDEIEKYSIQKGDLLVCEGGDVGRSAFVSFEPVRSIIIQNALHRVRAYKEYDTSFLLRVLQHATYADWFAVLCNKATIAHFTGEKFKGLGLPIPSLPEQQVIAAFLDHECARIDALIEKKRRLLELLEEKRRAVITQAVTRGLDSNAPMKDSGVEWLGQVPKDWGICALGWRYEVALGKMLDAKKITGNYLAPYLRNIDVQWGCINTDNLPEMDFTPNEFPRYSLQDGDLLVCEGGEVGRCAIWQGKIQPCYYQKALHRLRAFTVSDIPIFMFYCLQAAAKNGVFIGSEGKATIVHIPAEIFRKYRFPFPPLPEQQAIAAYLDAATAAVDAQRQAHEKSIALLQEYRASLITHAVTGKIDVRDYAPQH